MSKKKKLSKKQTEEAINRGLKLAEYSDIVSSRLRNKSRLSQLEKETLEVYENNIASRRKEYFNALRDRKLIIGALLFLPLDFIITIFYEREFLNLFGTFGRGMVHSVAAFGFFFGLIYFIWARNDVSEKKLLYEKSLKNIEKLK